ncbi:MAG TPA: amino acid ABC transporter permease [Bordetella sp.]|uniref:amino acid ABC transporter permease n=1 Tax=Bordetella sp. TaxID=28081 RepID=UPI002ED203E4
MRAGRRIPEDGLPPPARHVGVRHWLRERLFSSPLNTLLTVLVAWLLLMALPPLAEWLVIKAHWAGTPQACRADPAGACWAFIADKHRFILFGTYPYEQQWRPMLATVIMIATVAASGMRRFWNIKLVLIWIAGLAASGVLMWGGVLGLTHVEDTLWGGLPITLMLSVFGIAAAFPLGIVLALGRRSRMPAIRTLSVVYIELIRGVPLISLLFMASVMLPLFFPEGFDIDKLLRAQIAIILFTAAYIAEIVRGGLQAIPRGQYEGAESIGLSYWQMMRKIILPQALRLVVPPIVSTFIGLFKDTSLVIIIGTFDLMLTVKTAMADIAWRGFSAEGYVFVGLIYFAFCFAMSQYGRALEKRLGTGYSR